MLQRILGVVLVLAGLGAIVFGVASATVLRESDTVVATARPAGDGTMVVTDPGVLGLVASDVTVTASVPAGQEVTVVVGRDVDVTGWLGADPYTRVTGLADWETLSTEAVEPPADDEGEGADSDAAEGDAAADGADDGDVPPPADPAGSDMWVTELTDAEQVTLRWSDRPGRWVLLAAGTGPAPAQEGDGADGDGDAAQSESADGAADAAEAPTLELTWDRDVATPLLWPAVGVGGVLLVIGLVLLAAGRRRRKRSRRSATGAASSSSPSLSSPSLSSPSAASPSTSPATPDDSPAGPFARTTTTSAWPATVAANPPAAPDETTEASSEAGADGPGSAGPDGEPGSGGRSGTAPVPVAGRFSRRSRLRRPRPETSAEPPQHEDAAPAATPEPAPAAPEPVAPSPVTATGSHPTLPDGRPLTRRELRRQEEERRASGQSGMGRALRALTGQTPVVPPPSGGGTTPEDASPGRPASRRASAWRETWGFGDTTGGSDDAYDDTTDGGAR
ncbi:hypothetical protein [Isoptericola aurantiacus]|uniref:hypothetical protein n=1 Tax=Isoptericola aurantiacus TaxID=3377839 RepID=UPI00383BA6DA